MRKTLLGSLLFHVVVTVGFFQWIAFTQVKYVPRDIYTVKLVGSVAPAHAETRVEAPPKTTPVEEKKVEEKKDQMPAPPTQKPKPRPKPVEKKDNVVPTADTRKTDAKPDSALASAGEGAVSGPAGDTPSMGAVSIDGGDFPFASYISRLRQKIATVWQVPAGSENTERTVVVYFRVRRDGSVSNVTVEKSSDLPLFDRSCQRAVIEAAPLPPLPREYRDEFLGVHFTFMYQPTP